MRRVKFRVSMTQIMDALHIPKDCRIVEFYSTNNHPTDPDLFFVAEIPGILGETESTDPIEVNPVIHYEPEKYTWDWNISIEPTPQEMPFHIINWDSSGRCQHGFLDWDACPDCRH